MRLPIKTTAAERQIASAVAIAALFSPGIWALAIRAPRPGAWPLAILLVLVLALLATIAVGVYQNNRGGLTLSAFAYGFAWVGTIELVGAAFVVVTGRTPTRMRSRWVPRSSAIEYVKLAALWWAFALAFISLNAWRRPRRGR